MQLLNIYRSFACDVERKEISDTLQELETWLYNDGDDESEHVYDEKLEELKMVIPSAAFLTKFYTWNKLLTFSFWVFPASIE